MSNRGAIVLEGWRRATGPEGECWTLDVPLPCGAVLEFPVLAGWCDVLVDGAVAARSRTSFRPLLVPVPAGGRRIEVRAVPIVPARSTGPRPRWRNRLLRAETWRGVRTSLLGHIPGTGAPAAGPCAPVLLHPTPPLQVTLRASPLSSGTPHIDVTVQGAAAGTIQAAGRTARLHDEDGILKARLDIPGPPLWWPHTHGAPHLIDVAATIDGEPHALGHVGFRTIERPAGDGFALRVNGQRVFCRGAWWMGGGTAALAAARDAGMTMIRVPGSTLYPDEAFYDACDRLGLLVWQDFMFARFDYPADDAFLAEARDEAGSFLRRTAAHPSLAVLCGGDEVLQAAAMAGMPPSAWAHPLFDDVLPGAAAALRPDVPYVPHAPGGGPLPFAKSAPVTHYFGVSAYQRPFSDAAGVRFAAACLAFSNPPDPAGCRALSGTPGDAAWAAAVPRDPGAPWTFEDARDHYAQALFGIDPATLRRTDPERWLALGRAAVALAMQSAMTTWRTDPGCGGALVLALNDTVPGPGWGLLSHDARPKSALHALAQVWRPVQALLVDAGLDGVVLHLCNETAEPRPVRVTLRGLTQGHEAEVLAELDRTLPPRSHEALPAIALMGRFRDLAGTWRFGPPPFAVLGASIADGTGPLSDATLFPTGPALPPQDLGLTAALAGDALTVGTRRFAQFVAIDDEACVPGQDHFHLWPGELRTIRLSGATPRGSVSALNGLHPVHYR